MTVNTSTLDAYQELSAETAIFPGAGILDSIEGLSYVSLGLAGEAGEVANKVKKIIRDDAGFIGDVARAKIADELGDVLWYAAQLATQIDVNLSAIAAGNLAKLAGRAARGTIGGSGDQR